MVTLLFSTLALSVAIAWYVTRPLRLTSVEGAETLPSLERQRRLDSQERCRQLLSELEFDYSLKAISEEDYQKMKRSLTRELREVEK